MDGIWTVRRSRLFCLQLFRGTGINKEKKTLRRIFVQLYFIVKSKTIQNPNVCFCPFSFLLRQSLFHQSRPSSLDAWDLFIRCTSTSHLLWFVSLVVYVPGLPRAPTVQCPCVPSHVNLCRSLVYMCRTMRNCSWNLEWDSYSLSWPFKVHSLTIQNELKNF